MNKNYKYEINSLLDDLLESEDYYNSQATPLQTGEQLKNKHKLELSKNFEFSEFNTSIINALQTMNDQIQSLISKQEWMNLQEEFKHAIAKLENSSGQESEIINYRSKLDFTDSSMSILNEFGKTLLNEEKYQQAYDFYTFLAFLDPYHSNSYKGLILSSYQLGNYASTRKNCDILNALDPPIAIGHIYSVLCALEEKTEINKTEINLIEDIFKNNENEKSAWEEIFKLIK